MRKLRLILAILLAGYWLTIFVLTHIPAERLPHTDVSDKLAHFGAYGLLTTLIYLTIWSRWPEFRFAWLWTVMIAMLYGAVDEILQIPVNRVADVNDWLADSAGALVAATLLAALRQFTWRRAIARQKNAYKVRGAVKDRLANAAA